MLQSGLSQSRAAEQDHGIAYRAIGFELIAWLLKSNGLLLFMAAVGYAFLLASLSQQPAGSHPDETYKAWQVLSGERNFNHPLFLLSNLELGNLFLRTQDTSDLVFLGRHISNVYAAASVLLFALMGQRLYGTAGSWLFFAAFAANGAILVSGRYLKEDIFLIFGIALLALSLSFDRSDAKQSVSRSALIGGLGCALVISAKYIGAIFVVVYLLIYFWQERNAWRLRFTQLLGPFLLAMVTINTRAILDVANFLNGFDGEFIHATTSHKGIALGPLADIYLRFIVEVIPIIALFALPATLILLGVKGCRRHVRSLLAFSLLSICIYAAVIQLAPTKIPRYSFPLLVLLATAILVASCELWRIADGKLLKLVAATPVLALLVQAVLTFATIVPAIKNDTRQRLYDYVTTAPALKNAVILSDTYSGLSWRLRTEAGPGEPNPNGVRLRDISYTADACRSGLCADVDYIVIACTTFTRFRRYDVRLDAENAPRRDIYEKWLRDGERVAVFGSADEDFESRFGMYESPCLYVIGNKK